ncbi:inner centromere protein [Syncephalis fuscata]|nr:inner centromere protein [Syncephalis fuscata]
MTRPKSTDMTTLTTPHKEFTSIAVISKKSTGELIYDLPDIDSDFTDDDRTPQRANPKGDTVPYWAQSNNLTQQLRQQRQIDPDRIFGRVEPIRMEAIFKGREQKFRSRTSSAHWIGTDKLTEEEEQAYRDRMGYL